MDKKEKLEFHQSIETYFDEKRVYDLFERLLKDLVISKPKDPIDYLIQKLKSKKECQRIFITGYPGSNRKKIALSLSGENQQYQHICVGDLLAKEVSKKLEYGKRAEKNIKLLQLVDDDIVIDLLKKEMVKYEKENISYIVEGFPRNRVQGMFLQSVGILPDHFIILNNERSVTEARLLEKLKGDKLSTREQNNIIKDSIDQYDLNIQALRDLFKGYYSEIKSDNIKSTIEELNVIIKFKNETRAPRKPPRILLLGPPCSKKYEIAEVLARKLKICHISIQDLLVKEIKNKNENSVAIFHQLNNGDLVDDKYVIKLLEDRLYASDCMINGWILTGFPKTISQINFIKAHKQYNPSLVITIYSDDENIKRISKSRRIDPSTGKILYLNENVNLNQDLLNRLVVKNEDKEEILDKRVKNWKFIQNELETQFKDFYRINSDNTNIERNIELIYNRLRNDS